MEKSCYYVFPFVLLVTIMPYLAKTSSNLTTDISALLTLKDFITSDPHHMLARNWTNSSSVCSWIGVTCGLRHHRVTALNISSMGLSGTIPPHLGNLSFLDSVDLSYNHFSGNLPQELSLLHGLKFIFLDDNNIQGEIPPWFGHFPELEHLSLRNNSFDGFIPTSLSNLSNLLHLDFAYNSLHGEIPKELGRLHNLQYLNMYSNHLSGAIPFSIYNISSLQVLSFSYNELSGTLPINVCYHLPFVKYIGLSNNQFSGQIPSNWSQCSKLRYLSLSYNIFSGEIPASIGKITSLEILYFGGNNLQGVIPKEIGNLHNLVDLSIEKNNISGSLPTDIANLTMLKDLDISENNFTGVLPREIGLLYQLEFLRVRFNSFTGSIPWELFNISTLKLFGAVSNDFSGALPHNLCNGSPLLQGLYLGENKLSGAIPSSMSHCTHLTELDLFSNRFTGFIPHSLGNLSLLEHLNLGDNNLRNEPSSSELSFITSLTNCRSLKLLGVDDNPLHGTIPSSIGNFSSSFEKFFAYNCEIKGQIPADIGNLSNLFVLSLYGNDLSGNIHFTLKHMRKLQGLYLDENNLRGSIPEDLCHLQYIYSIFLRQNQLSGPIPECIGNLTSLRFLYLDSNNLTSIIPLSFWRLTDLLVLDLSSNSLGGSLPPEIGNLVAAASINLDMNHFSETIPTTIGKLQNLIYLSLAYNRLEGSIPVSTGSMINLKALDLSYNNLSGAMPKSLERLQYLNYFNVSFNALSGEIPTGGPFKNFTAESFKENKELCGIPRFHVLLCRVAPNHQSRRKKVQFVLFVLAGVVVFITIFSLVFIFMRYRRKHNTTGGIDVQLHSKVTERISYYEILQSTEQFSESNLLGIGAFGSVYRGVLKDGKVIAVKVFNLQNETAFRSFDVECNVLRSIRHRNLTKVISSCSNEDFRALVLEYMPMGSLEKWLYSHNHCFDVVQRLNIMIDVACALEYLHYGYSTPIVHCDLKPSNVLLDEEMIAHVGDFGISKLLGEEDSIVITNTLATIGYMAPEYGLEGLVSTRCDVYSYGVMLMEIFTRKRPSDDMFVGDLSLKSWVKSLLPQSLDQVIDINLLTNLDDEHYDKIMYCVFSILMLALKCSAESPTDRINMKETLTELQQIKRQFF